MAPVRALVVGGVHPRDGKTTVCYGLMAALRNLGFSVQPFIVGPGIKPACAYNEATGNVAVNLDSSLHQGATELLRAFWQGVQRSSADIAVVDGGVGLFDGSESEEGARSSAAEVAKILGTPCVLVMDGRHQRTAVALLDGLLKFDPDFDVLGVVFNKLAPGAQLEKLASQLREHSRPLVTLGGIPMTESLRGGVVGYYGKGLEGLVGVAEGLVREHVDVSRLLQLLRGMPGPAGATDVPPRPLLGGSRRARVALAQDELFEGCFPECGPLHMLVCQLPASCVDGVRAVGGGGTGTVGGCRNLALMQEAGAEVVTFSPLHDTQLPAGVGLVYLGSMSSLQQHPHLPLSLLSKNQEMCCELRAFAKAGGAVLSEGSSVALVGAAAAVSSGADSREYATLGIMPWTARLEPGRATMAYCQLLVDSSGCPAFAKGTVIGGVAAPAAQLELAADADVRYCCRRQAGEGAAAARDGAYMPGLAVLATWAQLHFGSCPSAAEQVVSAAAAVDALEVRRRAQRILTAQRVGGATGGGTAAPRRSAHGGCVQRGNAAVPQTRWSADSHVELGARADRMSMPATGGLLAGSFSAPEFGRARPARLDQPFSLRDSWDGAGSSRGSSASGSSSPERRLPQRVLSLQQPPPPPPQQQQQQQGVGRGGWEQLPPLYMHHLSSILPTCSISNQLALLNHHTRPQHPQQEAMRPRILSEDRAPLQPRSGPLRAWDSQPTAAALHARTAAGEAAALRSRESARSLSGDCGNPVVASAPEAAAQAPWGPPRWQASAFSGPHEVHLPPPLRAAAPPTLLERSASLPAADGPLVPPLASSPLWRRWSFAVHTAGGAAGGGTLWGSAVACLSPAAADIMQQLGLGHLLAAVPATAAHVPTSAKHLPAVLFQREALDDASTERARGAALQQGLLSELPCLMEEVDAAEVAQLQPQLLVLQHAAGWRSQRLVQQVKEASSRARREEMQVLDLGAKTLAGVLDGVLALGAAVGAAAAAQQLVDRTQRQLRQLAADAAAAAAAQRRGGGARSTRMLVLTSIAEELVLGGHWVPELTALAGGQDSMQVAGDRSRALSWKELTVLAPEVLVLSHAGGRQAEVFDQLRELMKLPGFWSVPAVYRSEVYIMDPAILARPGPQLVHGAAALARILGTAGARKLPAGHLQRLNLHPGQRCRPERLESHFTPVV